MFPMGRHCYLFKTVAFKHERLFAKYRVYEQARTLLTAVGVHFRAPVAHSTLADANRGRDWRLHADLAQWLMARARRR